MIRSITDGFLFCFSYFTVIPTFKKEYQLNNTTYSAMLFFLPFIGAILAVLTLYFAFFLNSLFAPLYAIFVAGVTYLLLYGFLHLEAVADVSDAWMAKYSNKDVYAIMKEPQVGSIGAIATFSFVLLKLAAIVYLLLDEKFFLFVAALMLSRLTVLSNLKIFEFHEGSIFAQTLKKSATMFVVGLAIVCYGAVLIYLIDVKNSLILLVSALIFSMIVLRILKKQFGFLNGDCIGFSIETTELLLLNIAIVVV